MDVDLGCSRDCSSGMYMYSGSPSQKHCSDLYIDCPGDIWHQRQVLMLTSLRSYERPIAFYKSNVVEHPFELLHLLSHVFIFIFVHYMIYGWQIALYPLRS